MQYSAAIMASTKQRQSRPKKQEKKPAKKEKWNAPTSFLKGKTVLVTGGTGTFGRAFIKQLLTFSEVSKVIVFSRDELKQSELAAHYRTEPRLRFFIGDVRDAERLKLAFDGVDIVVHAAALKRVESVEYNPFEAIQTNIIGSKNVIDAALYKKVSKVLLISSDKAVEPINLYGATKMVAEKLFIAANVYAGKTGTACSVVRYGNVVGSRGSFVELIERQKETGVITVTHHHMTRFWIRVDHVMEFVFEALSLMQGGETFVPKIKNMPVIDVVKLLAPSCKIQVIGMRPGEKLHEILLTKYETKQTYELPRMFSIIPVGRKTTWLKDHSLVAEDFTYSSDNVQFLLSSDEAAEFFKI